MPPSPYSDAQFCDLGFANSDSSFVKNFSRPTKYGSLKNGIVEKSLGLVRLDSTQSLSSSWVPGGEVCETDE